MPNLDRTTLRDWLATTSTFFGEVFSRCVIRVILWIITVIGAMFPPIFAANVEISYRIYEIAKEVNNAGLFRDFFYIVIVIALTTICEIVDAFTKKDNPNSLTMICYVLAFAWMIYVLIYGTGEFSYLVAKGTEKYTLPMPRFKHDFTVIAATAIVGLLVEMLLAFRRG